MYIINDMDLLVNLGKLRILNHILAQCTVAISVVKLNTGYSFQFGKMMETFCGGVEQVYSDEGFSKWKAGKGRKLSTGDLDSLYLAYCRRNTLVLSENDFEVKEEASRCGIAHEPADSFIKRIIKDENVIKLYSLLGNVK